MNKKMLYALLLLAVAMLVLIFNARSTETINLVFDKVNAIKSLIYLSFMGVGVVIGLLLK